MTTFEGPCLAGTPGCGGTPEYLLAERLIYERVRVFYRPTADGREEVWAEVDPDQPDIAPIEEEEDLHDVMCPNCDGVISERVEMHKIERARDRWAEWAEDRRRG